jgi:hypothetical protein
MLQRFRIRHSSQINLDGVGLAVEMSAKFLDRIAFKARR